VQVSGPLPTTGNTNSVNAGSWVRGASLCGEESEGFLMVWFGLVWSRGGSPDVSGDASRDVSGDGAAVDLFFTSFGGKYPGWKSSFRELSFDFTYRSQWWGQS